MAASRQPETSFLGIGLALGVAIGSGVGLLIGSLVIGIAVGLALGVGIGFALDANRRKTATRGDGDGGSAAGFGGSEPSKHTDGPDGDGGSDGGGDGGGD